MTSQTAQPFLERDDHLRDLRAAAGSGRVALVAGEAGIGKTTLVRAFVAGVPATTRVWWGACDPLTTPRPLGPLQDIASSHPESPLGALIAQGATRDALFNAFFDHLRQPGGLVILEDVHWADDATLDLLRFVGRRIDRTRGLLVLTYRSDEIGPAHPLRLALGEIPASATLRMALPLLSEEAVATLARQAGHSPEGLHAAAGGNPFFVTEILATDEGGVPTSVSDAVLARAGRLTPAAREVLDLASVVPGRIERWLVDAVLAPAPGAVDECTGAGMLQTDQGDLSFRHELARLSLVEALPSAKARELHGRVLRAIEARIPESLARLAHHAAGADEGPAVLRYAPAAARQAEKLGAHREAAAHYAAALKCASGLRPAERADLFERRSFECYLTGQVPNAIEARRSALEIWNAEGAALRAGDSLRWMSRLVWFLGHRPEAERYAIQAVERLEALPPGPALAMAYSNRSHLDMLAQHTDGAVKWGTRAIELAERLGHTETLAHALTNVGTARYNAGVREGRDQLERSLQLSLEHGMEDHAGRAYSCIAATAVQVYDYPLADRYIDEGIAYTRDRDLYSYTLYVTCWRARYRLDRGAWDAAAEDAAYVLAHPRVSPPTAVHARVVLGLLRSRRGDPAAREMLDEAERIAAPTAEAQRIVHVAAARAEAAWIRDDADGVAKEALLVAQFPLDSFTQRDLGALGDFLRRVGRPTIPTDHHPLPYRALAAGDWRSAAAAWTTLGCAYERALALAAGDDPAALREAVRLLEGLGATATIGAITRDARARGLRGVPRGRRQATKANPAELTTRQLEVLSLLAQGLRNAEIAQRFQLSPRTADHHVSAVLAKLGARTRGEAAAAARRLGITLP